MQLAKHLDEDLLGQVFDGKTIPHDPAEEAEKPILVPLYQRLEGGLAAFEDGSDELFVGSINHHEGLHENL